MCFKDSYTKKYRKIYFARSFEYFLTFQIFGALTTSVARMNSSRFDITFHSEVTITESFFPPFSLSIFFADLGGSLGLWLGVGAVQILGNCLGVSRSIKNFSTIFK